MGPDTQHSHNFLILSFGQSCPSRRYSTDTELSKHSQGHNRGTEARLQMWIKGRKKKKQKKAQECTIENTVLINRVSSHCTTRTEHMGSARSQSRGTGGKSQVLAASAQLRGLPAWLRGVAKTAQVGGQHGRSPVLRWGQWHIQWLQGSNRDPSSA